MSEILSQVDTSEAGAQSHPPAASAAAAVLPVPTDTLVDLNIPSSAAASREVRLRCRIYNNNNNNNNNSYLFQRVSIMLQRFNSVLLHDTLSVDLPDL